MAPVTDITKGSVLSKLLRHGSLYLVGNLIARFAQLLLIPLDTRLFTPDDYGTIVTITSLTRLMIIFVGLYLDAAYARFYHDCKHDPLLLRRHISTLYWFVLAWGSLVALAALGVIQWIVKPGIPVWPTLLLAFMAPLFTQLTFMSQSYLQQNHRSGLQVGVSLLNLSINIGSMLLAVGVFNVGMVGKFLGIFLGTGVACVTGAVILARDGYLRLTFSRSMLLQSLRFSVPLLPNIAAGWIAGYSDRLLISAYGAVADAGVYNVGYSLGRGFSLFSQSIFMVYGPLIYAWMTSDKETARSQLQRFVPYYYGGMILICLGLSLFSREVVSVLTPDEYTGAAAIVPIVLFAYFLGSQYQTAVVVLSFEKKTGLISTGAILQAVLNLGLNLLLIPYFGMMVAAWTTVISVGLYSAWMVYWSQKYFRVRIDWARIGLATTVAAGAVLVYLALTRLGSVGMPAVILAKLVTLCAAGLAFWFGGGVESLDRKRLHQQARTLVGRYIGKVV